MNVEGIRWMEKIQGGRQAEPGWVLLGQRDGHRPHRKCVSKRLLGIAKFCRAHIHLDMKVSGQKYVQRLYVCTVHTLSEIAFPMFSKCSFISWDIPVTILIYPLSLHLFMISQLSGLVNYSKQSIKQYKSFRSD